MKIKVLEHTGSYVPGFADVSEAIADRLIKSGQAEAVELSEISPVSSPEKTDQEILDDEKKAIEDAKVIDEKNKNQENV